MPFYRVTEQRMYEETYIVEAEDEFEARSASPVVYEGTATDSWGYDITNVEEIDDLDVEFAA